MIPKNHDPKMKTAPIFELKSIFQNSDENGLRNPKKQKHKLSNSGIIRADDKNQTERKEASLSGWLIETLQIRYELKSLSISLNEIRESLLQLATGKDGDPMNDDMKEMKTNISGIEAKVSDMSTKIAVLENTVNLRFNTVDSTLKDIKDSLVNINSELKVKVSIEDLDKKTVSNKWIATTSIALLAAVAAIVKLFL